MPDIDVHADISEVNEQCALDMSTYENLPKPCNAASLDSSTAIPKDDTDASYVFVTSTDATTTDDHVASDLNGQAKCSHTVDTEIKPRNGEFTDDGRNPESIFVSDALEDSQFKISGHVKKSDAIQDEIRVADVLQSSDAKADEAEPGMDSSQKVEETEILEGQAINESFDAETNSGKIHALESPLEVEDIQTQEENQIISTSEFSNTDANPMEEIEVHSSQMAEGIQIHEDKGIVGIMKSSDTDTNHGIEVEAESSQKADDIQSHNENGTVAIKFSDAESNPGEEVEVESSQKADIQSHEENGIVKTFDLSDTEKDHRGEIEVESSQKAEDIQSHEENVIVKAPKLSNTEANPRGELEVESSQKADDIQNHEENGIVKAPKLSNTEENPRGEIEVESSRELENIELNGQNEIADAIISSATMDKRGQESEVVPEDNETVAINGLSDTTDNCGEETEMKSFEREDGIRESLDANLEAADCHCDNGEEKVDEMVNTVVISDPVGGIGESQIISMGVAKSELDQPDDSAEDVKGECKSGVVLNEEDSDRTQITVSQDGEYYQVVGEEQESLNIEVSLLESSEGNKVGTEQHLAAAPSPLVNSEDVNGSISISTEDGLPTSTNQDDPLETIDDKDTVANRTNFHDHTKSSSASVDCDIATVEPRKLSPTMLISDPKVGLNDITMNEQDVNHVLELEEKSETASYPKVDECVKVEVLEGKVSENGDETPTAFNESRISYAHDSIAGSQLIPEEIEPVESTETAVSAVVIGNTLVELREMSSTYCLNDPALRSDLEVVDCTMSENVASADGDVQPDKEASENHDIGLLGNSDFETKCENGHIGKDNQSTFPRNDMRSESNDFTSIEREEERGFTVPEVPNGVNKSPAIQQNFAVDMDSDLHDNERSSSPTANEKSGDSIEITSCIGGGSRNIPGDDNTVSKTEVLKSSVVNNGGDLNPMSNVVFETEVIREVCQNEPSPISPEGSVDALEGQNVAVEAGTSPFYFLVKVPRFDDDNIREQIKCAQAEVDRKTKDRDAIRVQIQTMRVIMTINKLFQSLYIYINSNSWLKWLSEQAAWKVLSDNLEAAVSDGRAARDLLKAKRQEIDSVQSVITKVKNAMSVEDIDGRVSTHSSSC